jgi:hypothetical protein
MRVQIEIFIYISGVGKDNLYKAATMGSSTRSVSFATITKERNS